MFSALCILSPIALMKPSGDRKKYAFFAISGPNVRCERREETGKPSALPPSSWSGLAACWPAACQSLYVLPPTRLPFVVSSSLRAARSVRELFSVLG